MHRCHLFRWAAPTILVLNRAVKTEPLVKENVDAIAVDWFVSDTDMG